MLRAVQRLGRYEVRGELGQGGMGRVLRGWDARLRREVALKQVLFSRATSEEDRARLLGRFEREARVLALLRHPAIVGVYELGEDAGGPFLAMELVEGESLRDRLAREGPLPLGEVVQVGAVIARALQHAHAQGVLHRDVKLENVLLSPAGPRLIDFGLAKMAQLVAAHDEVGTAPGRMVGTPQFMSPEQIEDGSRVGPPCDVWGLGVTLYGAATGVLPFRGESLHKLLPQITRAQPAPPSRHWSTLPAEFDALILACLARRAEDRPTAAQLAERLEASGLGAAAPRAPAPPSPVELLGRIMAASLSGSSSKWDGADTRTPYVPPPVPVEELVDQAQVHFAHGEAEAAIEAFSAALELAPERAEVWAMRGVVRRRCGDPVGAAEDFEAALRLDPYELRALVGRGLVHLELGRLDRAELDLLRALVLLPRSHPRRADVQRALDQARHEGG